MKPTTYIVVFTTGLAEEVTTIGSECAEILAQAEQIKKGNVYTVRAVHEKADYAAKCPSCN